MNTNKHKTVQRVRGLKKKLEEWKNTLVGEDMHSIRNQIYNMIWDCAFFQCINESRRYAAKDDKGNIKQNEPLHTFINQSFFKTQLLSIRRLTDKRSDVYSLNRLIEDMKKHSGVLTRKNILDVHNLPYDYEEARADFDSNTDWTQGPVFEPNEIGHSEDIHNRIDSITGVTVSKRSPDDLIPDSIFKRLEDELTRIEDLCKYVNKYIAHSATPKSRKVIPEEIEGALGKVLNAHKIICEAASFIGKNLLFCGLGYFLPTPQFDQFEYLDEPMASKESIERVRQVWEKYRTETEQWCK